MEDKKVMYMTIEEINALPPKERTQKLKELRKIYITIINRLELVARKHKFNSSKNKDYSTTYELGVELIDFLREKGYKDEEIMDIVTRKR